MSFVCSSLSFDLHGELCYQLIWCHSQSLDFLGQEVFSFLSEEFPLAFLLIELFVKDVKCHKCQVDTALVNARHFDLHCIQQAFHFGVSN